MNIDKNLLNQNFKIDRIIDYQEFIKNSYLKKFENSGYLKIQPVDIASDYDKSTIFIGSSISTFKPLLEKNDIPESGAIVVQQCLRIQNKKSIYNDEIIPEYNSYFNIIGGIAQVNKIEDACEQFTNYLCNDLNIDPTRITIKINTDDTDLMQGIKNLHNIKIEENTRESKYYKWAYGMEGVVGRGLTYAIKNLHSGKEEDVGNIIVMGRNDKPIALQWGFGIETMLCRIFGKKYPIESSVIHQACSPEIEAMIKFQDLFAVALETFISGVEPGVHSTGCEQRDYLKGLSYLRRVSNISIESMKECGYRYLKLRNISDEGVVEKIIKYVTQHEKMVGQFKEMILELRKKFNQDDILKILDDPEKKVAWTREYRVNILEMKKIILSI